MSNPCRIEAAPAASGNEDFNPGVRRLRALDFGAGAYVTAYISSGQPHRPQSAYHDVCKILTDALAFAQHIL